MSGQTPPKGGTVLATDPGSRTIVVLCEGRASTVPSENVDTLKPGDIVRWDDDGQPALVWSHPTGEWPGQGSDAFRLSQGARWSKLRERARILDDIRAFFRQREFLEVETPAVVASAGTEVHLDPAEAMLCGAPSFLITSPEYHMKRLVAAGAPAIFQICKVWRDGEMGAHHRPEFTMLEWYRPFTDYHALMEDCEALVLHLADSKHISYGGRAIDLTPPWRRLTFFDALRQRGGVADPEALEMDALERILIERVEPTLGADAPEFLTDYPIAMASLARPKSTNPKVAERVELFIGGLELGNGFSELTDAATQRQRCDQENETRRQIGKQTLPIDEIFLSALAEGMPPTSGIAVGLDRLIMLLTDSSTISEVRAF